MLVNSHGLDELGIGAHFPPGARDFSFTVSRPASGPTESPMRRVPAALFQGVKRPGRKCDHSHLSSADVKHDGGIPSLRHASLWRGAELSIVVFQEKIYINSQCMLHVLSVSSLLIY
jgi:hypothetical protein